MSLGKDETYSSAVDNALREAKLFHERSIDLERLIGRLYSFGSEHGSHHNILVGKIEGIEVSDEGGLELYVSNPFFWGGRLVSIVYSDGKWLAKVRVGRSEPKEHNYFEGELELLYPHRSR